MLYLIILITLGIFNAAIFYQSQMSGKTLILLGCLLNMIVITLKYGIVPLEFWGWYGIGFVFGLVILWKNRHTIKEEYETGWAIVSETFNFKKDDDE